jgi:hypothetical protein
MSIARGISAITSAQGTAEAHRRNCLPVWREIEAVALPQGSQLAPMQLTLQLTLVQLGPLQLAARCPVAASDDP